MELHFFFEFSTNPTVYYGEDTYALATYTERRPVKYAIDLCSGSGIQAMLASQTWEKKRIFADSGIWTESCIVWVLPTQKSVYFQEAKDTSVFFDEARPIIEVCIYNTSLKNRLSEYARKYLSECQLADDELAKKNIKNLRQGKT